MVKDGIIIVYEMKLAGETMTKKDKKLMAGFLIPSLTGVLIFMIPIKYHGGWTIIVKIIADEISYAFASILPELCLGILTISAAGAIIGHLCPGIMSKSELLKNTFMINWIWTIVRILGCIFAWMTYLKVGNQRLPDLAGMISGADQGQLALDLIVGLVIIFLIASFLLPLLLNFGLLEFVGALLTRFMKPLFKVPGRAAVDCITSWIGDGTLGVMLTCNQYEGGYYNAKEASIIATCFSAVSITFSLLILSEVGLTQYFGVFYLLICFVGLVCAVICPRIWPLRSKKPEYLVEGKAMSDQFPPQFKNAREYGIDLALKKVESNEGVLEFFTHGAKNMLSMWFGVLPTVMCIGTVALMLANFTPIFQWLGIPFEPLLSLLKVPDADLAASTMVIGFTDMFTPAIIISGSGAADMTKFIVAVISITQVLFLDEVGGLILGSKLPVNLLELFVIFLERTVISILIVCPIAHLLF